MSNKNTTEDQQQKRRCTIDSIDFGSLGAFHERDWRRRAGLTFSDVFQTPRGLKETDFVHGKKFIICGPKGSGKTSFLCNLLDQFEDKMDPQPFVRLFLFDAQMSEDVKEDFSRKVAATKVKTADGNEVAISDYQSAWKWFIFRVLYRAIKENEAFADYRRKQKVKLFLEEFDRISGVSARSILDRIIPDLKKLNLKANNTSLPDTDISVEADFGPSEGQELEFSQKISALTTLFWDLPSLPVPVYVIFDELEISFDQYGYFQRDTDIIAGLIDAIIELRSSVNAASNMGLYVICALRTFVFDDLAKQSEAVNNNRRRAMKEGSFEIVWHQRNVDYASTGLSWTIRRKIYSAEKADKDVRPVKSKVRWKSYFPERVNGTPTFEYFHNISWWRPRDFVRLLLAAQKTALSRSDSAVKFDESDFQGNTLIEYFRESWIEVSEELRVHFAISEVELLKTLISSLPDNFEYKYAHGEVEKSFPEGSEKGLNADQIIQYLFFAGVIGNEYQEKGQFARNFYHLGTPALDHSRQLGIHPSAREGARIK